MPPKRATPITKDINSIKQKIEKFPNVSMVTTMRLDEVRKQQLREGNFDCFGRATSGYCDQFFCAHYTDCMDISREIPEM